MGCMGSKQAKAGDASAKGTDAPKGAAPG